MRISPRGPEMHRSGRSRKTRDLPVAAVGEYRLRTLRMSGLPLDSLVASASRFAKRASLETLARLLQKKSHFTCTPWTSHSIGKVCDWIHPQQPRLKRLSFQTSHARRGRFDSFPTSQPRDIGTRMTSQIIKTMLEISPLRPILGIQDLHAEQL